MSRERRVVLEMTRVEAAHLRDLVSQFADLLAASGPRADAPPADPAIARLVPDAYDDPDAAREFRELTGSDLLSRRADDATVVLDDLGVDADDDPRRMSEIEALEPVIVQLDADHTRAWMRTLAAIRLVLASRLGIVTEADQVEDDPRYGVYDWLGYRLDGLVQAADA